LDLAPGIGNTRIRNRSIMGSIHTGLEEEKGGLAKLAAFFEERAKGGVGLIITGGVAPNFAGRVSPWGAQLSFKFQARRHEVVTSAVHRHGAKICLQILHAGRYAYHPLQVAPSRIKAPINPFTPWPLTGFGVRRTIRDFVNCARLAQDAGYDGVEIMGSEGYLLNQFIAARTNKRTDRYGGSYENRIRMPLEVIELTRKATGGGFIIVYRLSMLDLVPEGSDWGEIVTLARAAERAGASILNTGIGWHEARVPTIATSVPRAAFSKVTAKIKSEIKIPVAAVNRINMPAVAESILAKGEADLVTMARPFLADAEFMAKARAGRDSEINTCIACNQACLDHVFVGKRANCLVNPRACYETEMPLRPLQLNGGKPPRVWVIGGGVAGMSAALTAAERGFAVTLFEAGPRLGGQFNLAQVIPGKEEFLETTRYYETRLKLLGVDIRLGARAPIGELATGGTQSVAHVIWATGVRPRPIELPREGTRGPAVVSYSALLSGEVKPAKRVAIIGGGGIGFDVAEFLTHPEGAAPTVDGFFAHWGIDPDLRARSGTAGMSRKIHGSGREVTMLQRKDGPFGRTLGKTTGWIHRASIKDQGVKQLSGVLYKRVIDDGLVVSIQGEEKVIPCDQIVVCAGQESVVEGLKELEVTGVPFTVVGGARLAGELDAKRAIQEGFGSVARI